MRNLLPDVVRLKEALGMQRFEIPSEEVTRMLLRSLDAARKMSGHIQKDGEATVLFSEILSTLGDICHYWFDAKVGTHRIP